MTDIVQLSLIGVLVVGAVGLAAFAIGREVFQRVAELKQCSQKLRSRLARK